MQKNNLRIVMTGGHAATPALAVIEELRNTEIGKKASIFWVGNKISISGTALETIEYKIFPKYGVKFYSIRAGKLQTKFTRYTISNILKIPLGFIDAAIILIKIKPKIVFSFGGFTSFPVVFWAYLFRIPIILHEQTVVAGRSTIASSFFATKIILAREESLKFFPINKSLVLGNPLTSDILETKVRTSFGKEKVILVFGGSRGSKRVNETLFSALPKLLNKYSVIHVTGEGNYEDAKKVKNYLPNLQKSKYEIYPFVNPDKMAALYSRSDLVICRSGANTVSELIYLKKPSILIPLPFTFMDEQTKNARFAQDFGVSRIITEDKLSVDSLSKTVDEVFANWSKTIKSVINKESPDKFTASKIVNVLLEYLL